MIPSSRPKLSDLYTLSQSKLLENHTLHSGTYLYSPYMAVPSTHSLKSKDYCKADNNVSNHTVVLGLLVFSCSQYFYLIRDLIS